MARWDVLRNVSRRGSRDIPYLLDVQADLLSHLHTRVVVPLYRASLIQRPLSQLQPCFVVEGVDVVMDSPTLVGVPIGALGPLVTNLGSQRDTITRALGFLFTGV
jgi:toxin CcdB